MPIPNLTDETPINQYTANSGETEFAFTFYIFALSDIKVYANDVLKTITTDYVVRKNDGTVIGDADLPMDGGKIIFNVGRTTGEKISLNRDIPVDRSTQFSTGGAFKADSLNSELTRILTIAQQLKRDVARSFRLAPSDAEGGSLQLPTNRANNILAFDANANLILTKFADFDKANVSPFIATLLDDVSASAARGTLGLAIGTDVQAQNANLTALAGLNGSANKIPYFNGAGSMTLQDRFATTTTQGIEFLSNPITISNNATDANNDIDFSAGNFILNNGSGQGLLTTALTKRLDATWSAGTNQGGLLSGTKAINSTYHWFAIQKPDGTVDVGAILGVNGTTPDPTSVLPSGYTTFSKNPIVSVITDGSGNIRTGKYTFFNGGYEFTYNNKVADATLVSLTTTKTPLTVSCPAGVRVKGSFNVLVDSIINAKDSILLFEGGTSIENAKTTGGVLYNGTNQNTAFGGTLPCYTNLSRQIDWRTDNYTLSTYLWTYGFIHYTN